MKFLVIALMMMSFSLLAITPDQSIEKLKIGNQRFIDNKLLCDAAANRLSALQESQSPFAIIVACSDSRASPDVVFDQSLGDLFVVRVAGNVVGGTELDSILFGALQLNAPLIVIMGHESCGAVKAVLSHQAEEIPAVAKLIDKSLKGNPTTYQATLDNIRQGIQTIKNDPDVNKLIQENKLKVIGAYFHLKNGAIEWLE